MNASTLQPPRMPTEITVAGQRGGFAYWLRSYALMVEWEGS